MNTKLLLGASTLGLTAILLGHLTATAGSNDGGGDGGTASVGADVIVGAIPNVSSYGVVGSGANAIMAYAIGTTSCNIGTAPLEWYASPDNRHPFIPMNAFKYRNGRFEQIGQSWGKHGFTALQQTLCGSCQSSGTGSLLGIGCSDPYSSSLNGSQSGLGARHEINAATGSFPGTYNSGMPSAQATIGRRLQIRATDLDPALNSGASYIFEAQYIHQQDATAGNKMNNASYRTFTVGSVGSNGARALTLTGPTVQQKPAIMAWPLLDPNATLTQVDVPNDGRFIAGVSVRDNGNGTWRYEYAVHNLNSHRSGRSFSIPVPAGVTVTGVGFKDVDYHSGEPFSNTDWTAQVSGGAVTWTGGSFAQSPNSNALRFATMYNFWFDADQPPTGIAATLGLFRPGTPDSVTIDLKGPSAPPSDPEDLNGDGTIDGADLGILLNNWGGTGTGDVDGSGAVDGADLALLLGAWG
ncbi:MAG: hypothetical protein GC172_03545 [Phycisphaera sp.]|nr:hypothetical protein [Phycisphaera sp.]